MPANKNGTVKVNTAGRGKSEFTISLGEGSLPERAVDELIAVNQGLALFEEKYSADLGDKATPIPSGLLLRLAKHFPFGKTEDERKEQVKESVANYLRETAKEIKNWRAGL